MLKFLPVDDESYSRAVDESNVSVHVLLFTNVQQSCQPVVVFRLLWVPPVGRPLRTSPCFPHVP